MWLFNLIHYARQNISINSANAAEPSVPQPIAQSLSRIAIQLEAALCFPHRTLGLTCFTTLPLCTPALSSPLRTADTMLN